MFFAIFKADGCGEPLWTQDWTYVILFAYVVLTCLAKYCIANDNIQVNNTDLDSDSIYDVINTKVNEMNKTWEKPLYLPDVKWMLDHPTQEQAARIEK